MSKEEKYDRQLRLWAKNGQSSLEESHVLVLLPTVTTVELLKNLVLPGIGAFTIVDYKNHFVDEHDLANNFFFTEDDLGHNRAKALAKNLNELNSDVKSFTIEVDSIDQFIRDHTLDGSSLFWMNFTLVVSQWHYADLVDVLYKLDIPLIIISSIGFFGFIRIIKPCFQIVETHPQNLVDLRLLTPWKELVDYSDSIDLENLDTESQSKIPYLIIQLKGLIRWKSLHNNSIPKTSQEKIQFKELLNSWSKVPNLLNFEEAISNSHKIFNQIKIPSNILDIFERVETIIQNPTKLNRFWVLVKALQTYVANEPDGLLPISGEVPDMDSDTLNYLHLSNIYKAKFEEDVELIKKKVKDIQNQYRIDSAIPDVVIRTFVKNSKFLYYSTMSNTPIRSENFLELMSNDLNINSYILLSFVVSEKFYLQNSRFATLSDLNNLIDSAHDFVVNEDDTLERVLHDIAASEGKELNTIASFMGGIGAQEALKILTTQYIPLDNTLVFDGIRSVTERWKLE